MYGLLQAFAKWLEGTPWGVGVRTSLWAYPFTQLVHFTGLSIWLGTNLALDLRLLGCGKAARDGRAASGRFVRLELDRLLHCRARRFSSVFLDRNDVSGQRRVPLEAGPFCSAGAALAHLRAMEGARLGSDAGHSGHREIFGTGGNFALGLRDHRGRRNSEPLAPAEEPPRQLEFEQASG